MRGGRGRISLSPLGSTINGQKGCASRPAPPQWEPLRDLERGDGDGGVLVRHRLTGIYALWNGAGSIRTLPQHKVLAALTA